MKEMEIIEKFIQLRAEGKSFDKIAKLIKVSKPTLIAWEKKYKGEIDELKWSRFENILEKYKLTQEDRIARLAKELSLAWE
ncbi:MAG: helix-turn-helix domain-containing protein, partial [Coriobacteriia bacterium]